MKTCVLTPKRTMAPRPAPRPLYGFLLAVPRLLVPLAGMAAAGSATSSCVPEARYEEAKSAADVHAEARRRAELSLAALQNRVAELEAELRRRDEKMEAGDQKLAEERFARGVAAKELSETSSLIEQLRAELARANQSLQAVASENARLAEKAGQNAPGVDGTRTISGLTRELETVLGALRLDPRVRVVESEDSLVVRFDARALFESDRASVKPEVGLALDAAGAFLSSHPDVRCVLREGTGEAGFSGSLGRERREVLVRLVAERRLGDRVSVQEVDGASDSTPGSYELVLTLVPPA